jgi:diguanylate cyclase (GGDEF)-like protein
MIDLDHFKDYNDAFGHQAGDHALQEFARVIRNEIRNNLDVAARYGGEEFVIVMPESNLASALNLAERIRTRLETSSTLQSRLTVSIGVAACRSGQTDREMLLGQADKALYKAKNSGRNRVCS